MRSIGKALRGENAPKLLRQTLVIGTPIHIVKLTDKFLLDQKVLGIQMQDHWIDSSMIAS